MRDFNMNESQAMNYPLARAFALLAFHAETHPFCSQQRVSPGYISQEIERSQS
jgi:hypothetical protein